MAGSAVLGVLTMAGVLRTVSHPVSRDANRHVAIVDKNAGNREFTPPAHRGLLDQSSTDKAGEAPPAAQPTTDTSDDEPPATLAAADTPPALGDADLVVSDPPIPEMPAMAAREAVPDPGLPRAEPVAPTSEPNPTSASPPLKLQNRYKPISQPPRPVDVQARLADAVASLEMRNTRLVDLLRLVSRLSTIPITLEPESLAMAGMTPTHPVSIAASETTVGDILTAVLEPRKLTYQVADGHLIVRSVLCANPRLIRVAHPVGDLVASDPGHMAALIGHIRQVVAPQSWQQRGGQGTLESGSDELIIQQTADVHFQVYVLCEKLRVARGQPVRSQPNQHRYRLDTRTAERVPGWMRRSACGRRPASPFSRSCNTWTRRPQRLCWSTGAHLRTWGGQARPRWRWPCTAPRCSRPSTSC